ncbi:MAG: TonB-dependent receptor, partial [Bacteroidaceae bacterium]|nr:TonB-dependent receptor [Bacteroidaceae bacterium]
WNRRFNAHLFDIRGGLRYLNSAYKLDTQIGYDSGNDKTPNMSSSLSYKQTDGTEDKYVDMTYYAQANYNYAERYYLLAALAMDGSSKFGVDAKDGIKIGKYAWGFFPSVAAAWVISNEPWYRIKGIDFLKLNVGFDMLGNDDVNSQVSRTYFVAGKMFNSISGKTLGNIGNTKLQWETTNRLTAGIQLAAAKNRIQFGINYFRSTTRNLLSLNALSYLTGMNTNWTNGGKLTNEGFDANFNLRLISSKNWTWSLGASIGHYKNQIKELPNGSQSFTTDLYGGTIISRVGQAAGMFYGYKTDGVFATTAEAAAANLYQVSSTGLRQYFGAGDMKFVDTTKDGIINDADRQVIGDPNPDAYGNIFTKLTYKHFTLDAVFNYSLGNDIYNYQRSIVEGGKNFYNQSTAMLHRWTYECQKTDIPHATYLDEMGNSRFSDRWIEDGSYLRLKNVTLSYDIPISSTYLQGITIWAAGNNLFTLTRYLGSDPEFAQSNTVLGQGIDRGLLPLGR